MAQVMPLWRAPWSAPERGSWRCTKCGNMNEADDFNCAECHPEDEADGEWEDTDHDHD